MFVLDLGEGDVALADLRRALREPVRVGLSSGEQAVTVVAR